MTHPSKAEQRVLAERFKQRHTAGKLLVLPNAWDAGSAVIFEKSGFEAVGTTSAGIAYSLGYPDGEHVTFEDLMTYVERILTRIKVPLSVDLETGYSRNPTQVVENVRRVIELGAVGINLEDGITNPSASLAEKESQCDLIAAVSALKRELDVPFVINARTDGYWLNLGDPETRLETTLERADAYARADADCLFVPGNLDRGTVRTLCEEIAKPLNLIATPNGLSRGEVEALGVARLSLGSGAARAAVGITQQVARELKYKGTFENVRQNALSYDATNELFSQ